MRAIISTLHTSNAAIIIRTTTVEETREQRGNGRLDRSPLLQFAFFVNLNLAILMVDIHHQLRLLPYITTIKQHSCKLSSKPQPSSSWGFSLRSGLQGGFWDRSGGRLREASPQWGAPKASAPRSLAPKGLWAPLQGARRPIGRTEEGGKENPFQTNPKTHGHPSGARSGI